MNDHCDKIGLYECAKGISNFMIGDDVNWEYLINNSNNNIEVYNKDKLWLRNFCYFQYGVIFEDTTSPILVKVVEELKRRNLWIKYNETFEKFSKSGKPIKFKSLYKTEKWISLRNSILKRDNYTCRKCGTQEKIMHVHHIKYVGDFIWDTPPEYLLTLCKKCHEKTHKRKLN